MALLGRFKGTFQFFGATPDGLGVVQCVGRDRQGGSGLEELAADGGAAGGNGAGEAERGGRVDTKRLVDDGTEVWEALDVRVHGSRPVAGDGGVEFGLQLGEDAGGAEDVVHQRAESV